MEPDQRLALYVHIPFCSAKCGYCDFNSYAGQEFLIPAYTQALLREAEMWSNALGERWQVDTLFFGGGTPSLMPLTEMDRLLAGLRRHFGLASGIEVTLEANPGTVYEPYFWGLQEMGVNRLSLGVQSFRDDELAFLGRIHSAAEAREAYEGARGAGFDNVSLDLIFGLPGQTAERWLESLEEALDLGPEHLSLYALTVEEGTPLARDVALGRTPAPDPDLQAELYLRAAQRLEPAAYEHYEISNWAQLGRRCRHNLTYWRNGFWLGLGAGAHSHLPGNREPPPEAARRPPVGADSPAAKGARNWELGAGGQQATSDKQRSTGYRFAAEAAPRRYIELVNETWDGWQGGRLTLDDMRQVTFREEDGPARELSDTLVLGLRLSEGVSLRELEQRFGRADLESHAAAFEEAISLGLLERAGGRLRLTARGRLLANEVFVRLLPAS